MVAEQVPRQLAKLTVVLMGVIPRMGKDDVRRAFAADAGEPFLDRAALGRKVAVVEIGQLDPPVRHALQKGAGGSFRLAGPLPPGTRHAPVDGEFRAGFDKLKDRAAEADLDIVGMSPDAEKAQRLTPQHKPFHITAPSSTGHPRPAPCAAPSTASRPSRRYPRGPASP